MPNVAIFGAVTRYVYSDLSIYTWVGIALICCRIFESNQDQPCDLVMSC